MSVETLIDTCTTYYAADAFSGESPFYHMLKTKRKGDTTASTNTAPTLSLTSPYLPQAHTFRAKNMVFRGHSQEHIRNEDK